MTRREALALGAAAGVTASVGGPASALAAAGPGGGGPHLRRATYAALVGEQFSAGGRTLTLRAVGDVLGARHDPALRGHDDAFELAFVGDADALPSAIHDLFHPLIGPVALFLGPVGAVRGLDQSYGVTVDRTVRVRRAPKPRSSAPQRRPEGAGDGGEGGEAAGADDGGGDAAEAGTQDGGGGGEAPGAAAGGGAPGSASGDGPPRELSERDLAVLREREVERRAPHARRRAEARGARHRLAATSAARARHRRRQRERLRRTRRGWLKRHGW